MIAPSFIATSVPAPSTDATKPPAGVIENWWRQGMMGGAKAHYDGIKAFSETDLATLRLYPGFPHGMLTTNADPIGQDLLEFIKG